MTSVTANTESSTQLCIASIGKLNYLEFFGLTTPPFRNTAEVTSLFLNDSLRAALSQIEPVLDQPEGGLILVLGAAGAGKTTLIAQVVKRRMGDATAAWINRTLLSESEFLQLVLHSFGIPDDGAVERDALIARFRAFLSEQGAAGRPVILVIDEAHNLNPALLGLLPRLIEPQAQAPGRLHIILTGQDSIDQKLSAIGQGWNDLVRYRASLEPLTPADTSAYIRHQFGAAGNPLENPFTDDAMSQIHQHTGGSMRLINTLCDFVLFNAYLGQIRQITPELVQTTFNALQWEPLNHSASTTSTIDPEPERHLPKLILEYNNDSEFPLGTETITIGRSADNDLCIRDLRVSRYHARLTFTRRGFTIEDMGSTNGVFVNQERIKIRLLNDGDVIGIDEHRLRFTHPR